MRKYRPIGTGVIRIKAKGHAFKAYGGTGSVSAFISFLGVRWGEL